MTPPGAGRTSRRRSDSAARIYARRYGDALRVSDPVAAELAVDEALAAGLTATEVQSLVIEPALVRIGDLWAANAATVADEHLATAISQGVMVKLFEGLSVARPRSRECVLLAAVEGQHHTVGLRMIADVLEGAGFDVLYLGADVPVGALGQFAAKHQPAVAGLAFTVSVGVGILADSIIAIGEASPSTRIMLGGRAVPPGLVEAGYPLVGSSIEAVSTVERLLREPSRTAPEVVRWLRETRRRPEEGRDSAFDPDDDLAARLAAVAEAASEQARAYVRSAGAFKFLALRDPVSDLGNRRAFDDRLHSQSGLHEDGEAGSMLLIDVDDFKAVNDTPGAEGDQVLRSVAAAIAAALRSEDFAARLGGDEFAVLLANVDPDKAREIADRVLKAVSASTDPPVTISIGMVPVTSDTRATMFSGEAALHEAKRAGGNRVVSAGTPPPHTGAPGPG